MPHPSHFDIECAECGIVEYFRADDDPERCTHCGTAYDPELRAAEQKEAEGDAELCKQIDQDIRNAVDDAWVDDMIASRGERAATRIEHRRQHLAVRGSWEDRR